MPPLKNARREQFARKYAAKVIDPNKEPNLKETYLEVYSTKDPKAAESCGSRLMSIEAVKNRVIEIINRSNPVEEISEDLYNLRRADNEVFHNGESIATVPNWNARAKGIEIWMKANEIGQNKIQINSDNRQQTLNLGTDQASLTSAIEALGGMIELTKDLNGSDSVELED